MLNTIEPLRNNGVQSASASEAERPFASTDDGASSDMFLKLLVAQVRNQDPMNPQDPAAFVSQLTQLSQLDAVRSVGSNVKKSAASVATTMSVALGARVGSEVKVVTDVIQTGGQPMHGAVRLNEAVSRLDLVLLGDDGLTRRLALGGGRAGANVFEIDPLALDLPPGRYTVRAEGDGAGATVVEIQGTLRAVDLRGEGAPTLTVAGVGDVSSSALVGFVDHAVVQSANRKST